MDMEDEEEEEGCVLVFRAVISFRIITCPYFVDCRKGEAIFGSFERNADEP